MATCEHCGKQRLDVDEDFCHGCRRIACTECNEECCVNREYDGGKPVCIFGPGGEYRREVDDALLHRVNGWWILAGAVGILCWAGLVWLLAILW